MRFWDLKMIPNIFAGYQRFQLVQPLCHSLSMFLLSYLHPSILLESGLSFHLSSVTMSFYRLRGAYLSHHTSQPCWEGALGLTDVASIHHYHHQLKRNHHPSACPAWHCHLCVHVTLANNKWTICRYSFATWCVQKQTKKKRGGGGLLDCDPVHWMNLMHSHMFTR